MECTICLRKWNSETCVPKSLSCGHSLCEKCLFSLFANEKTSVTCPTCQTIHKITESELQELPKNFSLLSLILDKEKITKKPKGSSSRDINTKTSPTSRHPNEIPESENEKINDILEHQPNCSKHNLLLHSYNLDTKHILCDACISELPKKMQNIVAIPIVCRKLRQKVDRARAMLTLRKSEIKKYKQTLSSFSETNLQQAESSITDFYRKLIDILKESEKKFRERFKGLCEINKQLITTCMVS